MIPVEVSPEGLRRSSDQLMTVAENTDATLRGDREGARWLGSAAPARWPGPPLRA